MTTKKMKSNRLVQWFGADLAVAEAVGRESRGCAWAGVPFVGGCSVLPHIQVSSGIAGDLHRHVVNLARVVREPALKDELVRRLDATVFHPDELEDAQRRCRAREKATETDIKLFGEMPTLPGSTAPDLHWAADYFVCSWMTAGGRTGTKGEFNQGLSWRWNANGGDSCKRFRTASESLSAWSDVLRPWNFVVLDAFEFLETAKDEPRHFYYVDAPWPDDGKGYKHGFTEQHQRDLAKLLRKFTRSRLVVRYGVHPLIEELYPRHEFNYLESTSRAQSNGDVKEALILNGASVAKEAA